MIAATEMYPQMERLKDLEFFIAEETEGKERENMLELL